MGAEVIENAATRDGLLAPAGPRDRAEAVEVGFEIADLPQLSRAQQLLQGQEVAIEAAVVIDRQNPLLACGQSQQLFAFLRRHHEGLLHQHILAGQQGLPGQGKMTVVRRGDDHQLGVAVGDQLAAIRVMLQLRMILAQLFLAAADGHQLQFRLVANEGQVEGSGREPVADNSSLNQRKPPG